MTKLEKDVHEAALAAGTARRVFNVLESYGFEDTLDLLAEPISTLFTMEGWGLTSSVWLMHNLFSAAQAHAEQRFVGGKWERIPYPPFPQRENPKSARERRLKEREAAS